jgi:predicted PurR-regulated permease PerM
MNSIARYILIGLGLILIGFILWYFQSIVAYVVIAAVLSLIGNPVVDLLEKIKIKKFRIPRWLGALFTLVFLWTLFFMFFRIFIPLIANEADEIASIDVQQVTQNLQEPLKNAEEVIKKYKITQNSDHLYKNL